MKLKNEAHLKKGQQNNFVDCLYSLTGIFFIEKHSNILIFFKLKKNLKNNFI